MIAYLMWRHGQCFEEAFAAVKAARGVANPNIGFVCQVRLSAGSALAWRCAKCYADRGLLRSCSTGRSGAPASRLQTHRACSG